jgi:hypothetical protein
MSNKRSRGAEVALRRIMSLPSAETSRSSPGWTPLSRNTSLGRGTLPFWSTVVIIAKTSLNLALKSIPKVSWSRACEKNHKVLASLAVRVFSTSMVEVSAHHENEY